MLGLLDLELQMVVSHRVAAGIEPGPSGGAANALNHRALSSVQSAISLSSLSLR